MRYLSDNNVLRIFPEGNIDSNNCIAFGNELDGILSKNAFDSIVFDMSGVKYISSSGLRVLLRVKKQYGDVSAEELSDSVYEIFRVSGFDNILSVQRKRRSIEVDDKMLIAQGANSRVYLIDDETVVKVFNDDISEVQIKKADEISKKALFMGIPTAISYDIAKVGDSLGLVYEMVDASSVAEEINKDQSHLDYLAALTAEFVRDIHSIKVTEREVFPDIRQEMLELAKGLGK